MVFFSLKKMIIRRKAMEIHLYTVSKKANGQRHVNSDKERGKKIPV